MSQANKNANRSFLDKFQGKTNKVGKTGMQSVLTPAKREISITQSEDQTNNHLRKVDLDELLPSDPNKSMQQSHTKGRVGRSRPPLKNPQKQQYVPSTFTPQTSSKQQSLSHPPSRSLSNSTEGSRGKYLFGKYLKLDKQALGHMQFLHSIEQKSFFKKSIRGKSLHLT